MESIKRYSKHPRNSIGNFNIRKIGEVCDGRVAASCPPKNHNADYSVAPYDRNCAQ
jgi:hypothetical protein